MAGVSFEGDQPIDYPEDGVAIRIFNLLSNGMGSFDWSGLEILVEMYGVEDIEGLIDRLFTIKRHEPPKPM